MAVVIPVLILGALLGGTIDLRNHHKTRFILNGKNQEPQITTINHFESSYKVIELSRDVCELYNVDPRLALIIKLDHFSNDLANHIRSSVISRDTIVDIEVRAVYKNVIESLPDNFKPDAKWNDRKNLGTHFIKKLRRGGEMTTTIRFQCNSIDHKENVLRSVKKHLGKTGSFDSTFLEKMDEVKKDLGNDYPSFHLRVVKCPSCFPDYQQETILQDLIKIAENLTEVVDKLTEQGKPIEMELEDLSTVLDFPPYEENKEVIGKLEEIEKMFDDVLIAREEFIRLDYIWSLDLSPEEEKQVNDCHNAIERARREFLHAIGHLDISPSASLSQFDKVYEAYGSNKSNDRFQKEIRALREKFPPKNIVE